MKNIISLPLSKLIVIASLGIALPMISLGAEPVENAEKDDKPENAEAPETPAAAELEASITENLKGVIPFTAFGIQSAASLAKNYAEKAEEALSEKPEAEKDEFRTEAFPSWLSPFTEWFGAEDWREAWWNQYGLEKHPVSKRPVYLSPLLPESAQNEDSEPAESNAEESADQKG